MQFRNRIIFETTSLKSLFSDSIIYGASSAINRLTIFLILPFYAKLLPPDIFVNINLISNFFVLINIIFIFGLDNIVAISYYNTEQVAKRKKIFSTWFWFELFINTIFFLFFLFFANFIVKGLTNSDESFVFIIAAGAQLFSFPLYILSFYYRLQRKPIMNLLIVSVYGLFLVLFNIYFLCIEFREIQGYFWSQMISNILISFVSIVILRNWINPTYFSLDLILYKIKKSVGMLMANVSSWVVSFSAIYFIQFLVYNKALAGVYQIVLLINLIISFIINAFAQALGPYVQSIKNDEEFALNQYKKIFMLYILIAGFIATTVSLFSKELVLLISNQKYIEASKFVFLLSFSTFFNGLSFIGGIGFVAGKKVNLNKFGFLSSLVTLFNIIFFVIFIPMFGLYGAALSSFLSSIILNFFIFKYASKYLKINYKFTKGIICIVIYLSIPLFFKLASNHYVYLDTILVKFLLEIIGIFVLFKNRVKII